MLNGIINCMLTFAKKTKWSGFCVIRLLFYVSEFLRKQNLLLYQEFRHIRAKTHYIMWYSNNHSIDILIMQLAMIVSRQCHSHNRWIKINFKLNWVSAWYIRYDLFRSFPFQTYKVSPIRLSSWYHFKQGNSHRFSILTPAIVPMRMCIILKIDKNCRPAYRMVLWTWVFRYC